MKRTYILLISVIVLLLCCAQQQLVAQTNTTCDNALNLTLNDSNCIPIYTTNTEVDLSNLLGCNPDPFGTLWYRFFATNTGTYKFKTNANFNDVTSLFTGLCGNWTEIECSNKDEFGFTGEEISAQITAGTTCYIQITGTQADFGKCHGEVCVNVSQETSLPNAPNNDNCANATTLTVNQACTNGTNKHANTDGPSPSNFDLAKADVWYKFVVNSSADHIIVSNALFSEVITLYSGTCGNFTEIASTDEGQQLLLPSLTIGQTYFVQLSGVFATVEGDFCIQVVENSAMPVANFNEDNTNICQGNTVQYSDQSSGFPSAWLWTFPGGTPATSTEQYPSVRYNSSGNYSVTLQVTNANGNNILTKQNLINVMSVVATDIAPYFQDFQAANDWTISNPDNDIQVWGLQNGDLCNDQVIAIDNFNQAYDSRGKDDYFEATFDLSSTNNAQLNFDLAYAQFDATYTDQLTVEAFVCGQTPVTIFDKQGAALTTASDITTAFVPTDCDQWRTETADLSAFDGQTITIRFTNKSGWGNWLYLDNINVIDDSCPISSKALPYEQDFETANDWDILNPNNDLAIWQISSSDLCFGEVISLDNFTIDTRNTDDILQANFDLRNTSESQLFFDVAYAQYNADFFDQLQVRVSVCGETPVTVYDKSGSNLATAADIVTAFVPSSCDDWRTETVDLSAYDGKLITVEFVNKGGYGNMLYLDNIKVKQVRCSIPQNITATVVSGNCAYIQFDEIPDARKYKLWYRQKGVGASWIERLPTASYFFLNGLTPNTDYEFKIKSLCDGTFASVWSSLNAFTTLGDVCDRPDWISAINITTNSATIDWSKNTADQKYKINYRQAGTSNWNTVTTSASTFPMTNLSPDTKYFYKVKTKCPSNLWTNWHSKQNFRTQGIGSSFTQANRQIQNKTKGTSIELYPNPTADVLNINLQNIVVEQLRITNTNGKIVHRLYPTQSLEQINIANLSNGVYFLHIITDTQESISRQFIKMTK